MKTKPKILAAFQRFSAVRLAGFTGLFVAVGVIVIVAVFAAGVAASLEPENGTRTAGATVIAAAGASGGHAIQFGPAGATPTPTTTSTPTPTATPATTPTPTPSGGLNCKASPHLCGFPDATNTGVQAGHTLTIVNTGAGDYLVNTAGATIHDLDISGGLDIEADNVTVTNVRVRANHAGQICMCANHITLSHVEMGGGDNGTTFTGTGSAIYSGGDQNTQNLIQYANIHHSDDGLRLDGGTTFRDSYIHNLSDGLNGSHSDGSQSCGGTYMQFIHNTIIGYNNDPIFLQGGDCGSNVASTLDHVLVDNNLILNSVDSSYGISIGLGRNITLTNNHFDHGWQVTEVGIYQSNTLVQDQTTLAKTTASNWATLGNIWDDTGAAVPFPGN